MKAILSLLLTISILIAFLYFAPQALKYLNINITSEQLIIQSSDILIKIIAFLAKTLIALF